MTRKPAERRGAWRRGATCAVALLLSLVASGALGQAGEAAERGAWVERSVFVGRAADAPAIEVPASEPWRRRAFVMPAEDDAVTIEHVEAAKSAMRWYLLSQQGQEGSWEEASRYGRSHPGGVTALVTFALLASGQPYQTDELSAAIDWLTTDPGSMATDQTYTRSLRAHVWASLPRRFARPLTTDSGWLATAAYGGLFDYRRRGDELARYDHSVTQYGLLGLWEASKRDRGTPVRVWRSSAEHFIDVQNGDGGWGYTAGGASTPTMSAAGTTALLIAQRRLTTGQHRPHSQMEEAIERGVRWLDVHERRRADGAGDRWRYYYLLSLERVALASGRQRFGGRDWLARGTREMLEELAERGDGSVGEGVVDTAFALVFLSRGAEPVWVSKVELPGGSWNHRPNDMARLTAELSAWRERELGWQVVTTKDDPATWLNAPLAYLSTSEAEAIDDVAAAALRRYVALGGQLIVNPVGGRPGVIERVRELGVQWFPGARWEATADGKVERLAYAHGDHGFGGGRSLAWLINEDWGILWQRSGRTEGHAAWDFITRRFVESHGSGVVTHRFDNPWRGLTPTAEATGGGPRLDATDRAVTAAWDAAWGEGDDEQAGGGRGG